MPSRGNLCPRGSSIFYFAISGNVCIFAVEMSRQEITKNIAEYFATQPVVRAWLFGSYARGEERDDSDVDILVDFDDSVSLLDHVRIMYGVEDFIGKKVDLVTNGTLLPAVEKYVNADKQLIYERSH